MHTPYNLFRVDLGRGITLASALTSSLALAFALTLSNGTFAQSSLPREEGPLLELLRSADTAKADKALACKYLAIYGSKACVTDLGPLLQDEQLASWARIALEAIPGPEADAVLRSAAESLQGKLLVGVLNSVGVRRDPVAVNLLVARLQDQDVMVASSAAVALGRIGNPSATQALRSFLVDAPAEVRSAVAEGCILCAERYLAEGHAQEATAIYDEVRKAELPRPRLLEATRGAILARGEQGIPLLIEQLHSSEKAFFQIALSTAREFPGKAIDTELANQLERLPPERAALLIAALADRPQTVDLTALLKAAQHASAQPVRIAAVAAMGRVGNATILPALMTMALDPNPALAQAAKEALVALPGDSVNSDILAQLPKAQGKLYSLLIELIGQRRIEANETLEQALQHSDREVRSAALMALGNTIAADRLPLLIAAVTAPHHREDLTMAQLALKTAAVRMPDRESCALEIAKALERSPAATQGTLLEILGAVGGTQALQTIANSAKASDPQIQDLCSRLLGEWMTIDAAPVLIDLAKNAPGDKYQLRAIRGYIRIARQFVMPEPQRVEMCQTALQASRQPAEQKLVLEILKRYASPAMMQLAIQARNLPGLQADATQAALAIAQKLGTNSETLQNYLAKSKGEKIELEIVSARYGAGETERDVTSILKPLAADSPLVLLPRAGYNDVFGGDPVPGVAKRLAIKYRWNGKNGQAEFPENALILLPAPQ